MEHYGRAGIEQIAGGVVVLRRSSGPNWTRAFYLDHGTRQAALISSSGYSPARTS